MKKKDYMVAIVVLCMAAVMAFFLQASHNGEGERVRIMIDGEVYGSYSLKRDCEVPIDNHYGYNKLVIQGGVAWMESADCPDGYCVEHKAISKSYETIVCLPHRLVVEIQGKDSENEYDSISR